MFILYSVINGATMSVIFLVYDASSIATVFFITAGTFGTMAAIGYTTKKDLTSAGRILFMALIGLVIATLVNLFLKNPMITMILSYIGVIVFVGLTAWDSQKIKQMLLQAPEVNEGTQKVALLGALTLYLDFVNLFLYLLRFLGRGRE
jgi:FtsH-binding integral membrane protein